MKKFNFFFELFSVGPTMNLRYVFWFSYLLMNMYYLHHK